MNARVGEKSPALVIHCTLTTKTTQVDYNKVTRVDNKKKQILRIKIRILIRLFISFIKLILLILQMIMNV